MVKAGGKFNTHVAVIDFMSIGQFESSPQLTIEPLQW
jgi:hypothetical protein